MSATTNTKKMTKKKQLEKDLDTINKSIKGNVKIDAAVTVDDIGTNNKKGDIFKVAKELYLLSKRMLTCVQEDTDENMQPKSTVGHSTAGNVTEASMKKMLTDLMPGLLDEALGKHLPTHSASVPEVTAPVTKEPIKTHSLLIEKIQGQEDISAGEWTTVVKKDVQKSLESVPVKRAHIKHGATKLEFLNKEDMDKAESALKDKYTVTSRTKEQKKLEPKLTISDLDSEITSKEMLEEKILTKNTFVKHQVDTNGEKLTVLFLSKDDRGSREGVIQVSAGMREAIRQNDDRLCIDLQRHTVRDRIHVIQCFHCQGYGHKSGSPYCKRKDENDGICFYCAGTHSTKECRRKKNQQSEKINCFNCSTSRSRQEREKSSTHRANDTLCPFYVREKERIMSRTLGCEAAKNIYLRRTQDLQKRRGRL